MPPHLRLDRRMCGVGGRRCGCGRVLLLDRDHLHRQMEPGELWFAFAIADHHHPGAGLKRVAAAAVSDKTHIKPSRIDSTYRALLSFERAPLAVRRYLPSDSDQLSLRSGSPSWTR